jgi:hypothetical protein
VTLDRKEAVEARDRLQGRLSEKHREHKRRQGEATTANEPDEAAIWEEVVRAHKLCARKPDQGKPWGGERKVRRLIEHAQEWEHRHLGSEAITDRKPLPPPRLSIGAN